MARFTIQLCSQLQSACRTVCLLVDRSGVLGVSYRLSPSIQEAAGPAKLAARTQLGVHCPSFISALFTHRGEGPSTPTTATRSRRDSASSSRIICFDYGPR